MTPPTRRRGRRTSSRPARRAAPRRPSARRRPERRDGFFGRASRALLTGLLLLILLLIVASHLGLLGRSESLHGRGDERSGTLVYQHLLEHPGGQGTTVGEPEESLVWRPLRPVPATERAYTSVPPDVAPVPETQVNDAEAPPGLPPDPIRVFLANGCGVDRLAAALRDAFRRAGFDVCGVSNADRDDYRETLVVDRSGGRSRAGEVCAFLQQRWGVGRVVLQSRTPAVAEVLVVLGSDLAAARGREPTAH